MTTGAAATSRCVRKYTAAATQKSIMQTKNTRRPSRSLYANCLRNNDDGSLDNLVEAAETLESVAKLWKRVMGERHPEMAKVLHALESVRKMLRLRRAAGD